MVQSWKPKRQVVLAVTNRGETALLPDSYTASPEVWPGERLYLGLDRQGTHERNDMSDVEVDLSLPVGSLLYWLGYAAPLAGDRRSAFDAESQTLDARLVLWASGQAWNIFSPDDPTLCVDDM